MVINLSPEQKRGLDRKKRPATVNQAENNHRGDQPAQFQGSIGLIEDLPSQAKDFKEIELRKAILKKYGKCTRDQQQKLLVSEKKRLSTHNNLGTKIPFVEDPHPEENIWYWVADIDEGVSWRSFINSRLMARQEGNRYKPSVINRFRKGMSVFESLKKYPLRLQNGELMDQEVITIENKKKKKPDASEEKLYDDFQHKDKIYLDMKVGQNLLSGLRDSPDIDQWGNRLIPNDNSQEANVYNYISHQPIVKSGFIQQEAIKISEEHAIEIIDTATCKFGAENLGDGQRTAMYQADGESYARPLGSKFILDTGPVGPGGVMGGVKYSPGNIEEEYQSKYKSLTNGDEVAEPVPPVVNVLINKEKNNFDIEEFQGENLKTHSSEEDGMNSNTNSKIAQDVQPRHTNTKGSASEPKTNPNFFIEKNKEKLKQSQSQKLFNINKKMRPSSSVYYTQSSNNLAKTGYGSSVNYNLSIRPKTRAQVPTDNYRTKALGEAYHQEKTVLDKYGNLINVRKTKQLPQEFGREVEKYQQRKAVNNIKLEGYRAAIKAQDNSLKLLSLGSTINISQIGGNWVNKKGQVIQNHIQDDLT